MYGPVNDNDIWWTRHNSKLYTLSDEPDIVKVVKTRRLSGWDTSLECKNWVLAESSLYLNEKSVDV